jgi:hypothetical protein
MFGMFKRAVKPAVLEYPAEFRRLSRELFDQFSIGDSPYEELLYGMCIIEKEMNGNGGGNWNESPDYPEYLEIIEKMLLDEPAFSQAQLQKIEWCVMEISECGRELEETGESCRNATDAVNYLVERVVDWCRLHPMRRSHSS